MGTTTKTTTAAEAAAAYEDVTASSNSLSPPTTPRMNGGGCCSLGNRMEDACGRCSVQFGGVGENEGIVGRWKGECLKNAFAAISPSFLVSLSNDPSTWAEEWEEQRGKKGSPGSQIACLACCKYV